MHVLVSVDSRTGRRTATTLLRLREGSYPWNASLSQDGRWLLAGGTTEVGALAYLVDLRTRRLVWTRYLDRKGYYDSVNAVAVHGDRALLATGRKERAGAYTDDWLVMGLDLRTGRTVWSSRHGKTDRLDQYPTGAVVTATGRLVVAGTEVRAGREDYDAVVRVYDPGTGRLIRTEVYSPEAGVLNEDWLGIALSPDGRRVGLVGNTSDWDLNGRATSEVLDADGVRVWRQVLSSPSEMQGYGVTWSADRVVVATEQWTAPPAGYVSPAYASIASTVVALDGRRGAELWRTTTGQVGTTMADTVTASPDGSRVYAVGLAGLVWGYAYENAGLTVVYAWVPADAYAVALDGSTGAVRWTSRWNGDDAGADYTYLFAAAATRYGLVTAGVNLASTTRYLPSYAFLNEAAPLFLRYDS
jgi:WD40 repeat protein